MRKSALLVVALVVLAGCNGLSGSTTTPDSPETTTSTQATTQTTEPTTTDPVEPVNVTEDGAELGDVNATKVWHRVGDLVGVDRDDPPPVVVKPGSRQQTATPTEFERSFGAENATYNTTGLGGYYSQEPDSRITIWRAPGVTDERVEYVLAHEFVHAYQVRVAVQSAERDDLAAMTYIEGVTEYVALEYAETHLDFDPEAARATRFAARPPIVRDNVAAYHFGAEYARNHTDADAPIRSMNENRPTTAEQVLHGLEPGSEQPVNLTVRGGDGDLGSFLSPLIETRGEAKLRFLLEYGIPQDRAAQAAEGWGNDRLAPFQSAEAEGWAWVVRWDSPSEADEFAEAFADFEANVSQPLALQRVGDDTTVVFSGEDVFVENATATRTAGNITVAA